MWTRDCGAKGRAGRAVRGFGKQSRWDVLWPGSEPGVDVAEVIRGERQGSVEHDSEAFVQAPGRLRPSFSDMGPLWEGQVDRRGPSSV